MFKPSAYILLLTLGFYSFGGQRAGVPSLEFELNGREYLNLLPHTDDKGELDPVMKMGKRLLDWLVFINQHRPEQNKLSLSSSATQPGYPIEQPRFSNPQLILEAYANLEKQMPLWLKSVVLEGGTFTENPPVVDADFIEWGLKVDVLYARASRWLLQEPYLWGYAMKKKEDIRGFYFLSRLSNLQEKLNQWASLSPGEQTQLQDWLVGLCYNSSSTESGCRSELKALISHPEKIYFFYKSYEKGGQERWDTFFGLRNPRSDVDWTGAHPTELLLPFKMPEKTEVEEFLRTNIEEEWQWNQWGLKLNFLSKGQEMIHIEFLPGATPHVNAVGGSTITMDANQPLTEYDVRWTIRHEFGHTLGFPDCYSEFYDTKEKVMISYQLDISNLMCSRRGHLKETHYNELKKAYFKK